MLYKLCLVILTFIVLTDATIIAPSLVVMRRTPGSPFYERGDNAESIYKMPKYDKNFHKTPIALTKHAAKVAVKSYKEQAKKPLVDLGREKPDDGQDYPAYTEVLEYYDETTVPYQQIVDFAVPKGMEMARGMSPLAWKIGDHVAPVVIKRLKKKKDKDTDDDSDKAANRKSPASQKSTNKNPSYDDPANDYTANDYPANDYPATDYTATDYAANNNPQQGDQNGDYTGNENGAYSNGGQ